MRSRGTGPRGAAQDRQGTPPSAQSPTLYTGLLGAGGFVHCGPRLGGTLYTGAGSHCTNPLQNDPSSAQSPHRRLRAPRFASSPERLARPPRTHTKCRSPPKGRARDLGEAVELRIGKQSSSFRKKHPKSSYAIDKVREEDDMELYDATELYEDFEYPAGIHKIIELGIVDLDWWWILEAAFAGDYAHRDGWSGSGALARVHRGSGACGRRGQCDWIDQRYRGDQHIE